VHLSLSYYLLKLAVVSVFIAEKLTDIIKAEN